MHRVLVDYADLETDQRQRLLDLEVSAEQQAYSGDIYSALYTLSSADDAAMRGFALLNDGVPRAFFLLKRGIYLPSWAEAEGCTLHALQVDRRAQRQGLGSECLRALPDVVRRLWPRTPCVQLSVDAQNTAGLALYTRMGWVDSGEAYRGRIDFERRLTLRLPV